MKGFTKTPNDLLYDTSLTDGELRQYLVLRHHNRNGKCFPDLDTLAGELNVSVSTIQRRNRKLASKGLIGWSRRGFSKSNGYHFLDPSIPVTSDLNDEASDTSSIPVTSDRSFRSPATT